MEKGRNTQGKFTKGHPGFKPKGALSKKKQQQLDQRLNLIFAQLDMRMEESIKKLTPHQLVKLRLELTKLVLPKLKRIPWVPDPPTASTLPVTFEFVHSGKTISPDPDLCSQSQ